MGTAMRRDISWIWGKDIYNESQASSSSFKKEKKRKEKRRSFRKHEFSRVPLPYVDNMNGLIILELIWTMIQLIWEITHTYQMFITHG